MIIDLRQMPAFSRRFIPCYLCASHAAACAGPPVIKQQALTEQPEE
jgi:hypothetical protein